jgi:hypothetical protein
MAITCEEQRASEDPHAQNQYGHQAPVAHASYSCIYPHVGAAHHKSGILLQGTQSTVELFQYCLMLVKRYMQKDQPPLGHETLTLLTLVALPVLYRIFSGGKNP